VTATDATVSTAGTTRSLTSGVNTHKAGGISGVLTPGTWSASGGTLTSTTASYDEAGSFTLLVQDQSYADVDVADGQSGTADRYIVGTVTGVGRFTPDRFTVTSGSITAAQTSATAFTYFAQDGLTSAFTLTPVNGASSATKNYRLTSTATSLGWPNMGLNATVLPSGSSLSASATTPTLTWNSATGAAAVSIKSIVSRPTLVSNGAPVTLAVTALPIDSDSITMAAAGSIGNALMRYGRLRLLNAYGSELLPIRIPVQVQYYTGTGWAVNTDDSASTLSAGAVAIGNVTKPQGGNLAFSTPATGVAGAPSLTVANGLTFLRLTPSATGVGSAFVAINLGGGYDAANGCLSTWSSPVGGATPTPTLMYLAGNTCNTSDTKAPIASVKFGSPKAPYFYMREKY
jgi:MSHA biogenesis protein MshQ